MIRQNLLEGGIRLHQRHVPHGIEAAASVHVGEIGVAPGVVLVQVGLRGALRVAVAAYHPDERPIGGEGLDLVAVLHADRDEFSPHGPRGAAAEGVRHPALEAAVRREDRVELAAREFAE